MTGQIDNKKLIERLRAVVDTATSDSMTVENDRVVTNAEHDACRAERDEAEAVRDLVIAALTPTDDEREALLVSLNELRSDMRHNAHEVAVLDRAITALRRSEVPEPSGAWYDVAAFLEKKGLADGGIADFIRENAPEPQGEPSDAQVTAEALRRWPHTPDDANVASARAVRRLSFLQGALWMRVALRAASAVTEQGSAEKPRCGGGLTHCRHDQWPPMHSMACPISRAAATEQGEGRSE
ncbi:hypothetical protein [Microbacterium maritypicum]|uniref:hypothetical protein n=1 Tax=Microbacterium maritypicum TaxID=33918 RepID=UPI003802B8E4